MRNIYIFFSSFLFVVLVVSCSDKKAKEEEYEKMQFAEQKDHKSETIRMDAFKYTNSIKNGGHDYEYTISRTPLDSAKVIVDAEGYKAIDNSLSLEISRDGGQIYSRNFTRGAFKINIDEEEFNHYVLMNMVFDKVVDNGLRFIVSLVDAASNDMFVQYSLVVAFDGSSINITSYDMYDESDIDRFDADEDGV